MLIETKSEDVQKEGESTEFVPTAALIGTTEEHDLYWLSLLIEHARIGLISDNADHPFIAKLKQFQQKQQFVTVHFKEQYLYKNEVADDFVNIIEFEKVPTAKENPHIENQRKRWVQLYLKFLAYRYNVSRVHLLPRVEYNRDIEGPLNPYVKVVNDLDESQSQKSILMSHFEKLNNVHWYRSEHDGFVYEITGDTADDLLENLIIGCWSIFVAMTVREAYFPVFHIIELTEKMMPDIQNGLRAEIINELMNLMTDLTFAPLDEYYGTTSQIHPLACMLIRSPMLFPLVGSRIKHLLHEKLETIDFNLAAALGYDNATDVLALNEVIWETYEGDNHLVTKLKLNVE